MELMPHQKDAVRMLNSGKILHGGVGTGKTATALAYYMEKEAPRNLYVITTAKKRDSLDWQKEASKMGIGQKPNTTLAGVLVVDSWNNVSKYVDVEDAFFIFDEQRLVGSGAWVKSFQKIAKKNRWILLSATPGDTWMDYMPVFIANNLFKNATQFKREHVVYAPFVKYPRIERYIGTDTLERYRNMLLVEMPFTKHTTRHMETVPVGYNSTAYNRLVKDRWNIYEDKPIQDVAELFRCMRKLVNSDSSRTDAIFKLMVDHRKMIVFYTYDYELEILRKFKDFTDVAEWNGHKKEPIPNSDAWLYLVQYVAGSEGWNCTETDTMVFYSQTYSWKNFEQAHGRIDRLDTPFSDLYYYHLVSNASIDKSIQRSLKAKKSFNERAAAGYLLNW